MTGACTSTVVIAGAGGVFALYWGTFGAFLGALGWGRFAAAFVPTGAIGFNCNGATPLAFIWAIGASLLINFGLELFQIELPYGFHGGAFALLVSLTIFYVVSMATPQRPIAADIEAIMDL
jgi:sodium/proline symporter/sodium/pantothenate symporter